MPYAVGDIYKVGWTSWLNGQLGLMLRYYRINSVAGGVLRDEDLAEGLYGFLVTHLADCQAADSIILGAAVRNLSAVPAPSFAISSGAAVNGTVTGNELPTQTCGIITINTARAGRSYRGRTYIPFPAAADTDVDARPTTSYMVALAAVALDLISIVSITVGGLTTTLWPVVYSKKLGTTTDVTAAVARRAWATQRSRGVYGAANPRQIAPV